MALLGHCTKHTIPLTCVFSHLCHCFHSTWSRILPVLLFACNLSVIPKGPCCLSLLPAAEPLCLVLHVCRQNHPTHLAQHQSEFIHPPPSLAGTSTKGSSQQCLYRFALYFLVVNLGTDRLFQGKSRSSGPARLTQIFICELESHSPHKHPQLRPEEADSRTICR